MKDLSLPRLALVLWFFNYAFLSLVNYMGGGGHEIMFFAMAAAVFMVVELVGLGLIEDMA